jgi:hypothetical protein
VLRGLDRVVEARTLSGTRRRVVVASSTDAAMVTLENWRDRISEDMRLRDFRPLTRWR